MSPKLTVVTWICTERPVRPLHSDTATLRNLHCAKWQSRALCARQSKIDMQVRSTLGALSESYMQFFLLLSSNFHRKQGAGLRQRFYSLLGLAWPTFRLCRLYLIATHRIFSERNKTIIYDCLKPLKKGHLQKVICGLQVFLKQPELAVRGCERRHRIERKRSVARGPVRAAGTSGAVLQAEEERAAPKEGPHYTRITETSAKCPFAGSSSFSTKETDYQSWKVDRLPIFMRGPLYTTVCQ